MLVYAVRNLRDADWDLDSGEKKEFSILDSNALLGLWKRSNKLYELKQQNIIYIENVTIIILCQNRGYQNPRHHCHLFLPNITPL